MNLRNQLISFEDWRLRAYPDPLTGGEPWTIGVGHCGPEVCQGTVWTGAQVGATLDKDIAEKTAQCRAEFPWFDSLNEPRQAVLVGMCFQMGITGLKKFTNTLAAVRDGHYEHAANGMKNSLWAQQTPMRAHRLADQMALGEWA